MNDVELQLLVNKAKTILTGVTTQKLREKEDVRNKIMGEFTAIKSALDPLIVEQRSRVFEFEPSEAPEPEAVNA